MCKLQPTPVRGDINLRSTLRQVFHHTLRQRRSMQSLAMSLSTLMLAACVPTTPQWDAQFGQSVRLAQQQQTLNPAAGGAAPVNGIDGASGREAIGRYRNSFKEPAPVSPPLTIGVAR